MKLVQTFLFCLAVMSTSQLIAVTLPDSDDFEIEVTKLEVYEGAWLPFNASSEFSCDSNKLFRLTIDNPLEKSKTVYITEKSPSTIAARLSLDGITPPNGVLIQNTLVPFVTVYSLIPNAVLRLPPGEHSIALDYACQTLGRLDLRVNGSLAFVDENIYNNMINNLIAGIFLVLAVYAIAFGIVTKNPIYLLYAGLNLASIFLVWVHFNNAGTPVLPIPGGTWAALEGIIVLSLVAFLMGILLEKRLKLYDRAQRKLFWFKRFYLLAPLFGLVAYGIRGGLVFPILMILSLLLLASLCFWYKARAEGVSLLLLAFAEFSGYLYLNYGGWSSNTLYYSYPAGMVAFNAQLFLTRLFRAYRYFIKAKLEDRQKAETERNLNIANSLQNDFMISDKVENIAEFFKPAESIGGDWYKYFKNNDENTLLLFVGDVTGHGVTSAHMTALVAGGMKKIKRDLSRVSRPGGKDLINAIKFLNHLFYTEGQLHGLSMTLIAAAINLESGKVDLVNVSHPHPLVVGKDGLRSLASVNKYLGRTEEIDLEYKEFQIEPGEQLIVYTDGLIENGDKKSQLKIRNLKKIFTSDNTPQENLEQLKPYLDKWDDHFYDDVTLVLYKHL